MAWRDASLSVKYKKCMWSSWSSRHSLRATSSERLELSPSISRPTFLDCVVLCSNRRFGSKVFSVCHSRDLKLQNPAPMALVDLSHEPFPAVHAPQKSNAPRSPDSVPRK